MALFDELLRVGSSAVGTAIDALAHAAKNEVGISGVEALTSQENFRYVPDALSRVCSGSQQLSPTGHIGMFSHQGYSVPVHVLNAGGRTAMVHGEPLQFPANQVRDQMAVYLLIRSGASPLGAWAARETAGRLELYFVAHLPMPAVGVDLLARTVVAVGMETINLLKMLGG